LVLSLGALVAVLVARLEAGDDDDLSDEKTQSQQL
jgi:hypothetical protein